MGRPSSGPAAGLGLCIEGPGASEMSRCSSLSLELALPPHFQGRPLLWVLYLRGFKGLDLPGQLHSMLAEVVHGDGVVPVAQAVLWVGRLLLPPQAAHCQQDGCGESPVRGREGKHTASTAKRHLPVSGGL